MIYFCCDQLRRNQLVGSAFNGIDYLEVLDHEIELTDPANRQKKLVVHFINDLAPNALSADVHVVIYPRFTALVREGSSFWDVSGLNVKAGLLKGLEIELESLRSFLTGGIEFATPPGTPRAKPGTVFFLYSEPKKEWLGWAPKIPLGGEK